MATADAFSICTNKSQERGINIVIYVATQDQPAFDAIKANLEAELAPKGELQLSFFLTILHAVWNAQRCIALEATLQNEAIARGLADAMFDDELARKLDRLYRYKKTHETARRQAIAELRKLQTEAFFRSEPKPAESQQQQLPSILVDTTPKSARSARKPKPQRPPHPLDAEIEAEIRLLDACVAKHLRLPTAA
jgi:hypothetical protein